MFSIARGSMLTISSHKDRRSPSSSPSPCKALPISSQRLRYSYFLHVLVYFRGRRPRLQKSSLRLFDCATLLTHKIILRRRDYFAVECGSITPKTLPAGSSA